MGDESQADYERYMAALPKAPVVWLHACKVCHGRGIIHPLSQDNNGQWIADKSKRYDCTCLMAHTCPQCGVKHSVGSFQAFHLNITHCYRCGWSKK